MIVTSKKLIVAIEIKLDTIYKPNPKYQFTKDGKCYNVSTGKEITQSMNGYTIGYYFDRKFKSLSHINSNKGKINATVITKEKILGAICERFGCTELDLLGRSTKGDITFARRLYALFLQRYITNNLVIVSNIMQRKSHESVIRLISEGDSLMSNRAFKNAFNHIENQINQ